MIKGAYSPVPFADVHVAGPFWRERLNTVLSRTIPNHHARLAEAGLRIAEAAEARAPAHHSA